MLRAPELLTVTGHKAGRTMGLASACGGRSPGHCSATHFVYDKAQRVRLMIGETWEEDGADEGDCPDNYDIVWAQEFRYDSGRARYLNRELSVEDLIEGELVALTDVWTDYNGDTSYNDYSVEAGSPPTLTDLRWYEPGTAIKDPPEESTGIEYYRTDHLGTTRGMTDSGGAAFQAAVFAPVGQLSKLPCSRLDSGDYHRYGYVGAHGYQAHDFPDGDHTPFLHVGARWYDPGTGRFMQRDPIGIEGGTNSYVYVGNEPTDSMDPEGLQDRGPDIRFQPIADALLRGDRKRADDIMKGQAIGAVVGCACVAAAAGAPSAFANPSTMVTVTRWGRPGLQSGDFVMKGGASRINYLLSGKWQPGFTNIYAPFSSGQSFVVPCSTVSWPPIINPLNIIKGMLGQRIFM